MRIGVWENGKFVGVILFGLGAGRSTSGTRYGLKSQHDVAELTRIALKKHATPVSRLIRIAVKLLRKKCPKLKLLISFADPTQGHYGGVYQAAGWIYTGQSHMDGKGFVVHGKEIHSRSLGSRYGVGGQSLKWLQENVDPNTKRFTPLPKHRYLLPLDDTTKQRIIPLRQPYPKRAAGVAGDTSAIHAEEGGSIPTAALSVDGTGGGTA